MRTTLPTAARPGQLWHSCSHEMSVETMLVRVSMRPWSASIVLSLIGGCEFRPFCNPLYYMGQLDFPMSDGHACHQATSDGQYDRKSSDDADSRSTFRARVHRIYLSAPVDAQAGAEV